MSQARVVTLPTAVVGPMENGRGYTLLQHSAGGRDAAAWEGMLRHFSLALGAWADRRAEPFVAMFPADDAGSIFAVARVRFLGDADLGTVAKANILIAPRAVLEALKWRSPLLLQSIPWPDDVAGDVVFAEAPIRVDLEALSRTEGGSADASFGLEWRDQTIDPGSDDPETVLSAALDGMDPPEQRARITGWATTDALARSGAFDPAAFRLIIRRSEATRRQPVETEAPAAWRAWRLVEAAARTAGVEASLSWKPLYAERAPEGVAAIAVLEACVSLDAVGRSRLLADVADAADAAGPLASAVFAGLALALGRLMEQPDTPEGAAYYLNAYIEAGADCPAAVASVVPLALKPGVLGWMSAEALDLLLYQGLADRLSEATPAELSALSPDARLRILKAAAREPIAVERQAVLAHLVAMALREPAAHTVAEQALTALLPAPGTAPTPALATPEAWATVASDTRLRAAFARRVLSPVVRGEAAVSKAAYVQTLALAARAVNQGASVRGGRNDRG